MCDSEETYRWSMGGGVTNRQSELVFKTELAERVCHGNGCYEEAVLILQLMGRGWGRTATALRSHPPGLALFFESVR